MITSNPRRPSHTPSLRRPTVSTPVKRRRATRYWPRHSPGRGPRLGGELCALRWSGVDQGRRFVRLSLVDSNQDTDHQMARALLHIPRRCTGSTARQAPGGLACCMESKWEPRGSPGTYVLSTDANARLATKRARKTTPPLDGDIAGAYRTHLLEGCNSEEHRPSIAYLLGQKPFRIR